MSFRRSASQFFSPNHHPTVVIKVGTSSLIRAEQGSLNLSSLASIVETARDLKAQGFNVIIVSSGAVGVGCQRLRLCTRPDNLAQKQALAAVGQVHLMRYYDDLFTALDLKCAQVLLTLDNLANRSQYINAKNTFEELLRLGAIPIVNENDTVAVQELRIGDNDTLSAQVATLVQADWLFLLTDVPNLFTANPNVDPDAQPIYEVFDLSKLNVDTSTKGTQWGTGGMATKLTAARIATAAGCRMVICSAVDPAVIPKIIAGERIGTVFHPNVQPLKGRKRWILSVPVRGEVWLDSGAQAAVQDRKKSLFSAGIIKVDGEFEAQDAVRLCDEQGSEFARALINYSSHEVDKVKGMSSKEFAAGLGYMGQEEVCHRANICLLLSPHDDSDHDHTSEPHSPYDGPSRTPTPPLGLAGQHAAAIAAAVAEVEAARAAGQEAGVRFQLPPRPPHHAGSSGSLGGSNGNGHSQQGQQEQQEQQQGSAADDIAARLAVLKTR
ncbi:hypothetical protein COHA_001406 [Chlorella ohadii]|uniref:PUA domain-containing protein n=1 Tax=Chlorella ohadii TaxID=2649997 RepID=A0AAD5DZC3_9CHLO|nr:hypothetical protein COHA_001406 [Chlorella ohadii]